MRRGLKRAEKRVVALVEDCATEDTLRLIALHPELLYARGVFNSTLLHRAAMFDCVDLIEQLIRLGLDVKVRTSIGGTALHCAAMGEAEDDRSVNLLLDAGCPIDARDKYGYSALMVAAQHSNPVKVATLLKRGANKALKSRRGLTALDEVAYQRNGIDKIKYAEQLMDLDEVERLLK